MAPRMLSPIRPLPLFALATLASIAACDLFGPPEAEVLTLAASQDQEATVGNAVSATPAVRAENQDGPLAGVLVRFVVTAGGGAVTGAFALTDRSGSAEVGSWRLGPTAGLNTLEARVEGLQPVVFHAIATPDRPASMDAHTGKGQTGVVAAPVPVAPSVLLRDQYNNPVADMEVRFEVTGGGGTVTEEVATSDADGVAAVDGWTLGTTAGTQSLVARFDELPELTFEAVAEPGPPAVADVVAGDGQTATVASELPVRPAVVVTDEFGNAVEGVPVTFDPGPSDGSITDAIQATDDAGRATAGAWTLGTVAGQQTLTVVVGDLEPLTITARARAGAPAAASAEAGAIQTATVGTEPPALPSVRVEDQFGNGVPNIPVTFTETFTPAAATAGARLVVGGSVSTGDDGVATVGSWTLGTVAGTYELTATIEGLDDPITFTANAEADDPAVITKVSGDEQSFTVGGEIPVLPTVRVTDQHGNPVGGVTIDFAVVSGGGSFSAATPFTNENGLARPQSWVLGVVAGTNELSVGVAGVAPVTFVATGTPGPPAVMEILEGDEQIAFPGGAVQIPPAVVVRDVHGNAVPGVLVTFVVTSGFGTVIEPSSPTTDVDGVATVGGWILGQQLGEQTLTASTAGVTDVVFTATAGFFDQVFFP